MLLWSIENRYYFISDQYGEYQSKCPPPDCSREINMRGPHTADGCIFMWTVEKASTGVRPSDTQSAPEVRDRAPEKMPAPGQDLTGPGPESLGPIDWDWW